MVSVHSTSSSSSLSQGCVVVVTATTLHTRSAETSLHAHPGTPGHNRAHTGTPEHTKAHPHTQAHPGTSAHNRTHSDTFTHPGTPEHTMVHPHIRHTWMDKPRCQGIWHLGCGVEHACRHAGTPRHIQAHQDVHLAACAYRY